jgi:NADH-quinone oxidoreductase subunit C
MTVEVPPSNPLHNKIDAKLAGYKTSWSEFCGMSRLTVAQPELQGVMQTLRDQLGYSMLVDVTAVDHLNTPDAKDRFEVVYILLDVDQGDRLLVSVFINEPNLNLVSMYGLWKSADWLEREVYDMFGIIFDGHPNFKRLLLPQEFASFPLRKDYPVQGRGERHNFPVITRAES